ncbi:hypothetical protein C1H46_000196 [Malus baccata]|uniref:EF-hand domain-containing protein n=1 Tax=Malus baccata TaxID=106549 RepID=A0A540NTE0_MALBA|nr:hypothetical protein C1H46_000196 [Malus baccata]
MSCIRIFLELAIQRMTSGCKKRKPPKLSSIFDTPAAVTSSFATMEVSNQFNQVFKVMDANGDGKISPLELSNMLLCLGYKKKISVEELQKVLVSLGCQKCRLKEYRKMIKGVDRKGDEAVDLEDRTTPPPLNTPKYLRC